MSFGSKPDNSKDETEQLNQQIPSQNTQKDISAHMDANPY